MFITIVVFALLGKLLMFVWRKSPYPKYISRFPRVGSFFKELFACELCLGCWLYFLMDFVTQLNLLGIQPTPILVEFLDGIIVSFLVWIFSAGWQTLFQNIVIGGQNA